VFIVRREALNASVTMLNNRSIVQLTVYLVKFWILHLNISYCS